MTPDQENELRLDIKGLGTKLDNGFAGFTKEINELKVAIAGNSNMRDDVDDHEARLRKLEDNQIKNGEVRLAAVEKETTISTTKLAMMMTFSGALGAIIATGLTRYVFH